MGRIRRKFSFDFKQQVANEFEVGLSLKKAARRYLVSPSLIARCHNQYQQGSLIVKSSAHEKALEKEN